MGFFDKALDALGVKNEANGLIREEPGSFEKGIVELGNKFDEAQVQDAINLVGAQKTAPQMTGQPPPEPAPTAPPPTASPPPAAPSADPAMLELLKQNQELMRRFAEGQEAAKSHLTKQQEEQHQVAEMQAWGMDPTSASDVRDYTLYKQTERLQQELAETKRFQQDIQQKAAQYNLAQQAQQGLQAMLPHLSQEQLQWASQRAAADAASGRPMAEVVAEYAKVFPAPAQPVPPQAQAVAPQQQPTAQIDPASLMQVLAQMSGVSAPAAPGPSSEADFLAKAERALFGGR